MRKLLAVLAVFVLLLLVGCGSDDTDDTTDDDIADLDDVADGIDDVDDADSDDVTDDDADDYSAADDTTDDDAADDDAADEEDTSDDAGDATGDEEIIILDGDCPLINTTVVMTACKRDYEPNVTVNGTTCVFEFGPNEVRVRSVAADESDFDSWLDSIYTSEETGVFKPRSGMAEERGTKYFAWFTGKKLVTVESSHVLACTGSNIQYVAENVDLDVKLSTEKDTTALMLENVKEDEGVSSMSNSDMIAMLSMTYTQSGALSDVDDSNASGTAKARFKEGKYYLSAEFEGLAEPEGDDFYEGWLVRKGLLFSVISTGKAEKSSGKYVNLYMSETDLTDHDFFVLTIESKDDGKPEDHVLEGRMS